jgi:type I restriction enzyme, S subunit
MSGNKNQSEIEWSEAGFPTLPVNWKAMIVDEIKSTDKKAIISGPFGSNISSKYFVEYGIPVIRGNNLSLELGEKFKDDGFVYITLDKANELNTWAAKNDFRGRTIGQVGFLSGNERFEKYIISNKQLRLTVNERIIEPLFAYYWFASEMMVDQIIQRNTGSSVPLINLSVLKSLVVPVPPLPEQKAISLVLSSLDDKIDLLHRQNKTLEVMAETLFRQWFVEEAQDDWEETEITKLFEVRDGTHDSPKQSLYGKPLITSKHIQTNSLDLKNAYLISEEDFNDVNKRSKVETNDILFSMIGTIGLTYFEQSEKVDYAIKNIGLFKTSQNPDWRFYTFLWLNSSKGKKFIHEYRSGSTQEYIALSSLRSIVFDIPSMKILLKFNNEIEPYFLKINNNMFQIHTLEKFRDTLLSKLMSGEVKVEY